MKIVIRPKLDWSKEYNLGWRYIVWVGGLDDYFTTYKDAKLEYDQWVKKGYDEIVIEKINKERVI